MKILLTLAAALACTVAPLAAGELKDLADTAHAPMALAPGIVSAAAADGMTEVACDRWGIACQCITEADCAWLAARCDAAGGTLGFDRSCIFAALDPKLGMPAQ